MAIKLVKQTPYGISVEYWKIICTDINWHNKLAKISLIGYIDETARLTGKHSLSSEVFTFEGDNFPFLFEKNIVETAYIKIKESKLDEEGNELNEWAKAKDC